MQSDHHVTYSAGGTKHELAFGPVDTGRGIPEMDSWVVSSWACTKHKHGLALDMRMGMRLSRVWLCHNWSSVIGRPLLADARRDWDLCHTG